MLAHVSDGDPMKGGQAEAPLMGRLGELLASCPLDPVPNEQPDDNQTWRNVSVNQSPTG
jgi:hypothetical protein